MCVTSRKNCLLFSLIIVLNALMAPLSVFASERTITARIEGIPEGTIYEGDDIQLEVYVSDKSKDYEYQFLEEYKDTENVIRDYATDNYFIPELNVAGTYTFYVNIREKGMESPLVTEKCTFDVSMKSAIPDNSVNNEVDKETELNDKMFVENNKSENGLTQDNINNIKEILKAYLYSNKSTKEYIARDIILNAVHTGGYGTIKYRFRENYNGKTTVVQDYSESAEYRFRTRGEGTHVYYVDVQDEEGQTATQSYTMSVVIHPLMKLTGNVFVDGETTVYENRKVTISAQIAGGYGKCNYEFSEVYSGKRTVVQENSINNSYTFNTQGKGLHTFYIDIIDEERQKIHLVQSIEVREYPTIISFFGDSLTYRGDWQTWLPTYKVFNLGIGSNTTKQMRGRINDVLLAKPNKVFILGGINDLGQGVPKSEILSNLESIVEQIQYSLPNTQIYLQSVLPTGGAVDNNEIRALNQLIKNMSIQKGVVYIELFDFFCNNGSINSSLYYMDGVHLCDKGYQKWISILKGYL